MKDPYFRRLSAHDKKAFWKIFSSLEISEMAKDLFEKMAERDPKLRLNISEIKEHPWYRSDLLGVQEIKFELERRNKALLELLIKEKEARKSEK